MLHVNSITSAAPAHVFLTGPLQLGKSTAIRRALALLDSPVGGFQTYFAQPRGDVERVLYLRDINDTPVPDEACAVVRFGQAGPSVDTARFDALGTAFLQHARETAALIVMDECGRLERHALAFQQAVLATLEGDVPVLGVVRHDAQGWVEAIRRHPRVRLVAITMENRDALPARLAAHFAGGEEIRADG